MLSIENLGVISSRPLKLFLLTLIFVSLLINYTPVKAEEYECSNALAVSHTAVCKFDDEGNYVVRGIIYIKNIGSSPAYITNITQFIQSDHSPTWISIREEGLLLERPIENALVIQPDEYEKITFKTVFSPEKGEISYRDRIILKVLNPDGSFTRYITDVNFLLPDGEAPTPPPTTVPPTTVPPTTVPPTTLPPTTVPPTTVPPTTVPPTTVPPTTMPPTTIPPTTLPPTTAPVTSLPPIYIGEGKISNIEADVCEGGTAVCVELTVNSGKFTQSSLHLVITSEDGLSWKKIYQECMDINIGGEGLTSDNTPLIFCFEDIELSGSADDYSICVSWKQGLSCKLNSPIISRECTDCKSIPAMDYLTYGVIITTLILIGLFYLNRSSKNS